MGKSIIIHLLTDGHPTDQNGKEDIRSVTYWIRNRNFKPKTYFSIVLCTDDESIERLYRRLERSANIDVSEDYRGESRDVRRARGRNFRFSYGDYVVKIMVGSFDRTMHNIDRRRGCILS